MTIEEILKRLEKIENKLEVIEKKVDDSVYVHIGVCLDCEYYREENGWCTHEDPVSRGLVLTPQDSCCSHFVSRIKTNEE